MEMLIIHRTVNSIKANLKFTYKYTYKFCYSKVGSSCNQLNLNTPIKFFFVSLVVYFWSYHSSYKSFLNYGYCNHYEYFLEYSWTICCRLGSRIKLWNNFVRMYLLTIEFTRLINDLTVLTSFCYILIKSI